MAIFREIVTKAVIGKGKKYFKDTYTIIPEAKASTVLGCWIINHEFSGREKDGKVEINGSFEINLWYAYDNDSKTTVFTKKQKYSKTVKVGIKNDSVLTNDTEIIIRALKQPSCSKVNIRDEEIDLEIEKELGIELVGDTKIQVPIGSDDESWEVIQDELDGDELDKTIEKNVKTDFIK